MASKLASDYLSFSFVNLMSTLMGSYNLYFGYFGCLGLQWVDFDNDDRLVVGS
jgi:hypothetical protein